MKNYKIIRLAFLLALVGFIVYLPSLFGGFIWDDEDFVYANKYVETARFDKFFSEQAIAGRGKLSNYYRPVQFSIYAVIHALFGFTPFVFHLMNVLTHIFAAIMIFLLFYILYRSLLIPFLIALFFLVHPIQTEAVSYISGLSDPLYVLFGTASVISLLQKHKSIYMYYLSLGAFVLCLLSKETGIVFLGILTVLWILKNRLKNVAYILPYWVITLVYLLFHFTYINEQNLKEIWGNNPYSNSVIVRILTFIQNIFTYFYLLVFPKDLYMERDFGITAQQNVLNSSTIMFIVLNIGIFYLFYRIKLKDKENWLSFFCYICFFVAFSTYSGIVLVNGMFYEHYAYLAVAFFFGFFLFLGKKYLTKSVIFLIGFYICILIVRNVLRQWDWIDSVRFYQQTLSYAPKSLRIRNNLAMEYATRGQIDNAISEYNKALSIDHSIPNVYHNLANAYVEKGEYKKAEENYLMAIKVDPTFYFSYIYLARLYDYTQQKDKYDKVVKEIKVRFPDLLK